MTFTRTITGLLALAAIGGLALVPVTAEAKDGNKGKSKSSRGKGNNGKNPKARGEHDNRREWDSRSKRWITREDDRRNDRNHRDWDDNRNRNRDWDDDRYRNTRDWDDDRYRNTRDWDDDRYRDTRDWDDDRYRSRSSEYDRRQETKNEWRNIAYVSGAAALIGYLNHDETLMFTGIAGALYSVHRYEQDRKSQNQLNRLRASYFSRPYFIRDGRRYERRTVTKNGQKYYQFVCK